MNFPLAKVVAVLAAVAFSSILATPATAQATRTWVSGVGDDANPCSRTAPCKTFAGAISKTAAAGEINCLDPGGFGAVTITKSITISCLHTVGGLLAGGTNGVVVNAGAADVVVLRGLDIYGVSAAINGVRFVAGGALHIEQSQIRRFNAANGAGVLMAAAGPSELFISDTAISENGSGSTGGGVIVRPGGGGGTRVTLSNVRILNNANAGFQADMTGSSGGAALMTLDRVTAAGNGNGVHVLQPTGTTGVVLALSNSTVVNNSGSGLLADGTSATMLVGNTTISGNGTGVSAPNSGKPRTYGDNRLNGNTVEGAFFGTPLPKS